MSGKPGAVPDPTTLAILQRWDRVAPDDRIAHLVRDTARALTRALQLRLSAHDVTFGHWVFLRILWEQDGLSQRDLSVQAGLTEPTAHSALRRMEELGYVSRRRVPGNRRKLHVFLRPRGRALRDKLVPLAEEVNAVGAAGVEAADLSATRRTLLAMIHNLAADEVRAAELGRRVPPTRRGVRGKSGR